MIAEKRPCRGELPKFAIHPMVYCGKTQSQEAGERFMRGRWRRPFASAANTAIARVESADKTRAAAEALGRSGGRQPGAPAGR